MKMFKCAHCGKMIVVLDKENIPTICCGEPMKEIVPNTEEAAHEKHLPIYKVEGNVVSVEVGSVLHPMLENHYIGFIMLETNMGRQRKVLKPGDEPKAKFALLPGEKVVAVYEYCNLHGLWKA